MLRGDHIILEIIFPTHQTITKTQNMTVKIKPQVHPDADYSPYVNYEFEVADPFFEIDLITLKNGDGVIYVSREDCEVIEGRMPTDLEIIEQRWLPETPQKVNFQPCDPNDE